MSACGGVKDDAANAAGENSVLVGTTDKVTSLDPAGSYDNGSYAVQIQVFPFLYAQDYNTSELSPDIAADDGTWSKDGKQFTVKIKDGLKFANGHTLDSKDVRFSYDRIDTINDPNGPSSLLANIDSIETPDANTVVFNSKVPFDVTLKQVMSSPAGPIVDDEVFSADKITDADTIVSGKAFAGPYQIDSFKLNEAVSYSKNGNYQGLTPVKNSGVQVKYFADASNLKMAVEQGQVDVAYRSLSPTHIEDLGKNSKVKVVKGPGGEVRMLAFNFKLQPYGESQKDADAAKAKKTLSDAGVATPVDLKLQYNGDHYGSSSADEYAAIKSQLEADGLFKVDLQQTEWTQYNKERVVTDDSDGSYPVYQLGWFPDYSDPDNYLSPFFRDGNFVNNGYSNKKVNDAIVAQAGEKDEAKREGMLKDIQKTETDDLSTLPMLQGNQVAVTGSNVSGVVLDPSFRFRYASVVKN